MTILLRIIKPQNIELSLLRNGIQIDTLPVNKAIDKNSIPHLKQRK